MDIELLIKILEISAFILWITTLIVYINFAISKGYDFGKMKPIISLSIAVLIFFLVWIGNWWSISGFKYALVIGSISGVTVLLSLLIMHPLSEARKKSLAEMKEEKHEK